jgi:protein SCO1/2
MMMRLMNRIIPGLLAISILIIPGINNRPPAQIIDNNPPELKGIDVEERLNSKIPLDFHFIDDRGDSVMLSKYFHQGKPVILMMGYYSCPMLCGLIMNGIVEAVNETSLKFGEDYQIVSVSIDPQETDLLASARKKEHLNRIGVPENHAGWMFLTGSESESRRLADAIGFKYYYDESKEMYAHAAVLIILTEDGRISRYLYGIKYEGRDFRMAVLEASRGKVSNTIDRLILYCYHYDPDAGGYVIFAGNVMRLGGALTLAILVVFLGILWYRDRRKKSPVSDPQTKGGI